MFDADRLQGGGGRREGKKEEGKAFIFHLDEPRPQLIYTHIDFLEEVWISDWEACETISAELDGRYLGDCPE